MHLFDFGWTSQWEATFEQHCGDSSDWRPARVARQDRGQFTLFTADGPLFATVSGRIRHEARDTREQPAVGDWVAFAPTSDPELGRIQCVLPRHSAFVRKVAGKRHEAQVVAANLDTVFLVTGLDQNFNLRRIERYLALAAQSGADPVIVLNKLDLCPDPAEFVASVEAVAGGCPVIALSALHEDCLDELQLFLRPMSTAALLGSSGVGKSTLLNTLLGEDRQSTQANRANDARGRHTTTNRELFQLPGGALLIDTPGMRELALVDPGTESENHFAHLEELAAQCRFSDCQHETEPGCAVQAAVAAGELDPGTLVSWRKIQRERDFAARQQDARLQRAEAAKWKRISQMARQAHALDKRWERK